MPDDKRCCICGNLCREKYKIDVSVEDGHRTVIYFCETDGRKMAAQATSGAIVVKGIKEKYLEGYYPDGKRADV